MQVVAGRPLLLALLVAFGLGVLVHSQALPLFEGSDEDLHYAYVEHIRATGTLPDRTTALTNATKQISGHAPLTYLVGAVFADVLNLPRLDDPSALYQRMGVARNPWNTPGNDWNRLDNHNFYYSVGQADPDLGRSLRMLRLLSLSWGLLGIVGAYGAACEVFRARRWALLATILFAFLPTYVHSAAYFNNDISATALATLAIWCALRLLRLGPSSRRLLVLGALVGLAGLAKINALAVAPAALMAVVLVCRPREDWLRLAGRMCLWALPVALVLLPWLIWGALTYGDPLGTNTHVRVGFVYDPPLTLPQLAAQLPNAFTSYWARFGLSVAFYPVTYTLYGLLVLASLAGYAAGGTGWLRSQRDRALVLATFAALSVIGLLRWMSLHPAIPARLILPAHAVFAIGLAGGLLLLARRLPRLSAPLRGYAAALMMSTGILEATIAIAGAFGGLPAPTQPEEDRPAASAIDFDSAVRLVSAQLGGLRLAGDRFPVTLCWDVLRVPDREPAYTVKLIGDSGILSDRTTLFGLGLRPTVRWHDGDSWCETVDIPLSGRARPPASAYDVVLNLLDANTFAADWPAQAASGAPLDPVVLGRVYSPAGDMRATVSDLTAVDATFGELAALRGYALSGDLTPGETVHLRLLWEVTGATPDDWTQFIHLVGDDVALSLIDGAPRGGDYPTNVWSPGEWIADAWTLHLPDDLPPGAYHLDVGFYRHESGERMPITQDGVDISERMATILTFPIE
ncbi:MAG: glycosyltransferase family 39 protein [Anaerolineae bacterium]|nr:glycosyltransferase family 39 protein [Anaerolineae bacterium]